MTVADDKFSGKIRHGKTDDWHEILYSYFMPVCSIVKTITPRWCERPDALLHEAEGRVYSASGRPRYRGVIV